MLFHPMSRPSKVIWWIIRNDITDLGPLSGITHVTGDVRIVGNDALTSLGDFSALQTIGGSFEVGGVRLSDGNDALTSLGDFSALQAIGGSFEVRSNDALNFLGELYRLTIHRGQFCGI